MMADPNDGESTPVVVYVLNMCPQDGLLCL